MLPFRRRRNISPERSRAGSGRVADGVEADVRQQLVINVCVARSAARFVQRAALIYRRRVVRPVGLLTFAGQDVRGGTPSLRPVLLFAV